MPKRKESEPCIHWVPIRTIIIVNHAKPSKSGIVIRGDFFDELSAEDKKKLLLALADQIKRRAEDK